MIAQHAGGGSAGNGVYHGRKVGKDCAKADGQQQRRLVVFSDGQIDQHACNGEHGKRLQARGGKQVQHSGKQLFHDGNKFQFRSSLHCVFGWYDPAYPLLL